MTAGEGEILSLGVGLAPTPTSGIVLGVRAADSAGGDLTARGMPGEGNEWSSWLHATFAKSEESQTLWFLTSTFAPTPFELGRSLTPSFSRVSRAARDFEKFMTLSLGEASYFGVMEVGKFNGRRHLHSLISSRERSLIYAAREYHAHRFGFSKLMEVREIGGVAGYVAKYVAKSTCVRTSGSAEPSFFYAGGPLWHR